MTKTYSILIAVVFLSSCATHYTISSTKEFNIKPTDKFIVRLTDTDFVVDSPSTRATVQLLQNNYHQVMPVHEFDSINYRYILHLNDSWEPTREKLRILHMYADYDYLLVGGFFVNVNNFYFFKNERSEYEKRFNLNLPEKSVIEFRFYLYNIRTQQLDLTIIVRKSASGSVWTHLAFGTKILDKAIKKLEKYLQ